MPFDSKEIYKSLKGKFTKYDEEVHCPLILSIMNNYNKGTIAHFCAEAKIGETKFFGWVRKHDMFAECYYHGKCLARVNWENEGRVLKDKEYKELGCSYEYWRMVGWSRFGVGKNSRIRINLDPANNPAEHYSQLLIQASEGDFTAGEIKQLMEAINVGLNAYQVFELQKQIDDLKSDLEKMESNKNVKNLHTN